MADKAKAALAKDKGNKALAAKNYDEAIAMYTEVGASEASSPSAWRLMARAGRHVS